MTKIISELRAICLVVVGTLILFGCGGGGGGTSANSTPTAAEVAAITPVQIATYADSQITALGTNINSLSNAALGALTYGTNATNPTGQIETISAVQIATLSPAQVRLIGAAGAGGSTATSLIRYLNAGAWAALVNDPLQVAAITSAEIPTLTDSEITALGTNISFLSNAALGALTFGTNGANPTGQIESISAVQIAALSPAQVRLIGATGAGGATFTSEIIWLNAGAWTALANDPAQVAAITPAEIATLTLNSSEKITALGTNIKYLSDAALGALTYNTWGANSGGQIEAISVAQIAILSPAQVRLIGATGAGGATFTSQIVWLNAGAWAALANDPAQVAAITPAEIATLTVNSSEKITALGTNIKFLSDAALGALTASTWGMSSGGQIQAISAAQIAVLSSAQIGVLAGTNSSLGIAYLNLGAFGSLSAAQVATLTPANIMNVSAAQLASLTPTAIAGLTPATIASLTVTQKSLLTTAQHTACGC